jgi:ribosomal protein L16 Arg81 hydroxylase
MRLRQELLSNQNYPNILWLFDEYIVFLGNQIMTTTAFDFTQLIYPLDLPTFLEDYWAKRVLYIPRSQQNYYSDVFSLKNLDTLMQYHRLRYPIINLATNQGLSMDHLEGMNTYSPDDYGVPNLFCLYRTYAQGNTLILHRLNQYWQAIATLCRSLESFFTHPVGANLFVTRKQSDVYSPHFDTDEIFVLQLEGGKLWHIYNSTPLDVPDPDYDLLVNKTLPPPEQEIYLEAGDMLYLPAGCIHGVKTVGESSVHLAIGIQTFTWADLLKNAVSSAKAIPVFSEALPVDWLNSQIKSDVQMQLIERLQKLQQEVEIEAAIAPLADRFLDSLHPLPSHRFAEGAVE